MSSVVSGQPLTSPYGRSKIVVDEERNAHGQNWIAVSRVCALGHATGRRLEQQFSKCFFNLPFIRAERMVCLAMFSPEVDKLPDSLELNDSGWDLQFATRTGSN
ncbi:uncharacterized protein A1O9_11147 [Exophiala aquamarina CBS 119918]|uniref:Uncharacterized protein n=1 Tax=Exophiala aquamarina CBS 119918 TaxID=1182545 RepID=A0A072PAY9_9EURO|nr:uncharacterized protein A1O9_11147 [Exophiala aquamarina CBS 119918]KEF52730.1 hypothetical protein A1O9_11147 [Exophiala aquamarina CBS 119918]